jgi:hypothetical protein
MALLLAFQEPRQVLCLYDSTGNHTADSNVRVHLESVLNYLGLLAVYSDVNRPLPTDAELQNVRGVLTWWTGSRMKHSRDYWRWIAHQPVMGRKVVILGNLGATDSVPVETVNAGLRSLGLTYRGRESGNVAQIEILKKTEMVEFERTIGQEIRWFVEIHADPGQEVFLRVRRKDLPDCESDLVVVGPSGGFAWITLDEDSALHRQAWWLNPYAFLSKAFQVDRLPKPDLTTAMGRRIFFSTIDGEGLAQPVQPGPRVGRLSGEVVRDEFLRRIDLPVTASVIAADLDEHADLARSIFSLPNVEVASHGYYHPLDWGEKTLADPQKFDLRRDIVEATHRIEEVSPKPVRVFLWTGDSRPPPEAIALTDSLGLANLDGSDADVPRDADSSADLGPASVENGGRTQFSARSPSENEFTDLWSRDFFAARNVLSTYRWTESPRRLTPIRVAFHYYLVQQPSGESALREIFDWVGTQEIFPLTASEYVAWIRGFNSAQVEEPKPGLWRISHYGACRTIRFDLEEAQVDLSRSTNVLGFRRSPQGLYVHLGEGDRAEVALGAPDPAIPYVVQANGFLEKGRIVARMPAQAVLRTREGLVRRDSPRHEMEVDLR